MKVVKSGYTMVSYSYACMQSKSLKYSIKFLLLFLGLFTFLGSFNFNVHAQNGDSPGEVTRDNRDRQQQQADIEESLKNCPDSIKEQYSVERNSQLEGTYIVGYGPNGAITLSCPDPSSIEKLIIRLFVFLTSIVGVVFSFATGKSAVLMITAFENQEAFQEAAKSLKNSILAVFGVFFAYIVIVFIMVGLIGVGGSKSKYNLVCQHRIVFSLTLDNPNLKCGNDAVETVAEAEGE